MPDNNIIKINVEGLEQTINRIRLLYSREANSKLTKYLAAAGRECATRVLWPVVGLRKYPPATAANQPGRTKTVQFRNDRTVTFRMPWYERTKGSHIPTRGGGWKFVKTSENLGKQWYVKTVQGTGTEIGNRASYAQYVVGEEQARAMGRIGWKQLAEVAADKVADFVTVYTQWLKKVINDIGF